MGTNFWLIVLAISLVVLRCFSDLGAAGGQHHASLAVRPTDLWRPAGVLRARACGPGVGYLSLRRLRPSGGYRRAAQRRGGCAGGISAGQVPLVVCLVNSKDRKSVA